MGSTQQWYVPSITGLVILTRRHVHRRFDRLTSTQHFGRTPRRVDAASNTGTQINTGTARLHRSVASTSTLTQTWEATTSQWAIGRLRDRRCADAVTGDIAPSAPVCQAGGWGILDQRMGAACTPPRPLHRCFTRSAGWAHRLQSAYAVVVPWNSLRRWPG